MKPARLAADKWLQGQINAPTVVNSSLDAAQFRDGP